jgi:hypothetical protein
LGGATFVYHVNDVSIVTIDFRFQLAEKVEGYSVWAITKTVSGSVNHVV